MITKLITEGSSSMTRDEIVERLKSLADVIPLRTPNAYTASDIDVLFYAAARLSALPPRDELLREALEALEPFAAQSRASGPTEERNIRRARAAADKIRTALGGE